MGSELGGRQREDQPAAAGIDRGSPTTSRKKARTPSASSEKMIA
jgi:hypothetical protein